MMEYIQVINNIVNLIGGKEVGLPLSEEFLTNNPNVLNFERVGRENVKVGWYYHSDTDEFTAEHPESPVIPSSLPEITTAEVVQQINDLRADLIIAGVI